VAVTRDRLRARRLRRRAGGRYAAAMPPLSRTRKAVFVALTALVPIAVVALGIELVLPRFVTLPVLSYHFWGNRPVTLLPGVEHHALGREYDVRLRTNALGFNDVEHARERAPGVLRILLLGDSYVEATHVPPDRHFARRIEALAAQRGAPLEAIAMGASNQGQSHQLANYEALGRAFAPDVVVTFFCVNDPWNNLALDSAHGGRALYVLGADGRLASTIAALPEIAPTEAQRAKHAEKLRGGGLLAVRRMVRRAWDVATTDNRSRMAARMAAVYDLPDDAGPAVREDEQRLFEMLVARLRQEVVDRDHHRLVAVVVSGQVNEPPGEAYLDLVGWAREAFAKEGVPLVDLDARFRDRARAEGRLPSAHGDPHWNETGHAWVAEALFEMLAPDLAAVQADTPH
jgi:hypothetical protein